MTIRRWPRLIGLLAAATVAWMHPSPADAAKPSTAKSAKKSTKKASGKKSSTRKATARKTSGKPAARTPETPAIPSSIPQILPPEDQKLYAEAFEQGAAGKWADALATAARTGNPLLLGHIRGEALLAGYERSFESLQAWLASHADLPQAPALHQLARASKPAAAVLPPLPDRQVPPVVTPPPRAAAANRELTAANRRLAQRLADRVRPLLTAEKLDEAEEAWRKLEDDSDMPATARADWAARIAWRYYLAGDDIAAIRLGTLGGDSATSDAANAQWVAGLAAWRLGECERASRHFDAMNAKPDVRDDIRTAGLVWAARAHFACGRPEKVTPLLRRAVQQGNETFYGLVALRLLGFTPSFNWGPPSFINADWNQLAAIPAVQRAVALVRIGQLGLADRELKNLWGQTDNANFDALVRLAAALGLPATQNWLSARPPAGHSPPISVRYPSPDWVPYGGWRVDRSLVYAFALQESRFQTNAVSRAGARGVMQLMPGTAQVVMKAEHLKGVTGSLTDPVFNLELGQTYLEKLRDYPATAGALPKVIASYNAGPGAVQRWTVDYKDDPLLFIESIPFAETRDYVEKVMRNYWMYQLRNREPTLSLDAIAAGAWPMFPGTTGPAAIHGPLPATNDPDVMPAVGADPIGIGLPPEPLPVRGRPLDPAPNGVR